MRGSILLSYRSRLGHVVRRFVHKVGPNLYGTNDKEIPILLKVSGGSVYLAGGSHRWNTQFRRWEATGFNRYEPPKLLGVQL